MHRRLAMLMFLQYAVAGAFVPLFSVWLTHLEFSPMAIGWASATSALASLVAPLLAGQVADRWVPAERCIAFADDDHIVVLRFHPVILLILRYKRSMLAF